jgi:hypothetical protein
MGAASVVEDVRIHMPFQRVQSLLSGDPRVVDLIRGE